MSHSTAIDTTLPLRAINAYAFCPRLFWLEYFADEFVDNEHTIEGSHVHRRVDTPGGAMDPPEPTDALADSSDEPWHTRSLWLSSTNPPIQGKLDLVDVLDDGSVMPVDTKKGAAPPQTRHSDKSAPINHLWRADRVQLTLQALLLRSHGYTVHQIAAWYHSSRKRVTLPLSQELIDEALHAFEGARKLYQSPTPPPPLVDSPKCNGCSLVGVCQPDELNALQLHQHPTPDDPVRRVLPPRDDALPLYVHTPGTRIGLKEHSLIIKPRKDLTDQKETTVGFGAISQVNLMGTIQISTQALQACLRNDIPVSFFSTGGWYYGRTAGMGSRQVHVRIAQFKAFDTPQALSIARVLIADKIANSRTLLRRNLDKKHRQAIKEEFRALKRLRDDALQADSAPTLLGLEGNAARIFWPLFSELVAREDDAFAMKGRNRRPPEDPTNALLSYGYALLTKDATLAALSCGLDAYLGVFHTPHHGRPSMALDLMEPFRPLIVDSIVHQMIRRREVTSDDFIKTGQAVAMKQHARKKLIQAYERRMDELITHPTFGYRISYRRVLYVQARLLARVLTGEIDALPAFRTR